MRLEGRVNAVTGAPVLGKQEVPSWVRWLARQLLFSALAFIVLPAVLVYALVKRSAELAYVWHHVMRAPALEKSTTTNLQDTDAASSTVWKADSNRGGAAYAATLEWQTREGFCSVTTMRCVLKSLKAGFPELSAGVGVPPVMYGPDDLESHSRKLLAAANARGAADVAVEVEMVHGVGKSHGGGEEEGGALEEHYASFLQTLALVNHPSGRYRVAANYLRGALFGPESWWPAHVLLALLGGHFSPIVHFDARTEMLHIFDVNAAYGLCVVPARKLFHSTRTVDIATGKCRGLVVTKLVG
jgi:hypothetical protein